MLGILHRKRLFDVRSVHDGRLRCALLKTAAIGDTVLLSAVIREIRHAYPRSSLTLVVSKSNYGAVSLLNGVDEVVVFDMTAPLRSLRTVARLERQHLVLDFSPWARIDSLIAYCIPADRKIGFKRRHMHRHYVYDATVEHSDDVHELENYRNILRAVPMATAGFRPQLSVNEGALRRTGDLFGQHRRNVVFHPFPGGYKKHLKEWPIENWIRVGRELIHRGCRIYITGDQDDAEAAEAIKRGLDRDGEYCSVLCGRYPLAETAAILSRASLLITVNTGVMHIGAAVSARLIALHGPTSPERWGPVSDDAVVVRSSLACSPCISLGSEYRCDRGGCMETIAVEEVLRQAEMLLMKERLPGRD